MTFEESRVHLVGLASVCALLTPLAMAQTAPGEARYPVKVVRIIVGFTPGGAADVQARVMATALTEPLGQQVIVDNRPGQDSIIGTSMVAKSPPDGYTIAYVTAAHAMNSILHARSMPYHPVRDFAPVSLVASGPLPLVVNPALPVKDLKGLIALAKKRPGQLNFASAGAGGTMHLAGELLKSVANIDMVHVPYKGGGQALTDVIAGQIELTFVGAPVAMPHIRSGRLRVLAVSTKKRAAALPDVPTVAELGYPDFEVDAWYGVLAPRGTPGPIVNRLSTEIARSLATTRIKEAFLTLGIEGVGSTPEQFTTHIEKEIVRWTPIVHKAGLKIE